MGSMTGSGCTGSTGQSYGSTSSSSPGSTGQSYGTTGGYYSGQGLSSMGLNGMGSQNLFSSQQIMTSGANASLNNPATVLAYAGALNLTSTQIYALEKMLKAGKQRAALVLNQAQRKELAEIVGMVPRSRAT